MYNDNKNKNNFKMSKKSNNPCLNKKVIRIKHHQFKNHQNCDDEALKGINIKRTDFSYSSLL